MSIARNFRVTVNLSNFFHDHRNRARIFINDDIQTIRDLEDRIEKIFNIQNFHLSSQNEFLPPSEDARILQKDDIIWVMQNGENYNTSDILEVSSKKSNKKSKSDHKKRSISLTDGYIEEELRSPKKKKKKKSDTEKKKVDISSPLKGLSKEKKKKAKTPDSFNFGESVEDVDMKTPTEKKIRNKSIIDISNENKVSTTIEEDLNSSKNSVMNINTLLPVLQSHISTYNKKMSSNQLNKTSPCLTEISSSTVAKESESDDEKKKYTCKGNLPFYKKKIQLPTITDKYLNKKKINIVKIEYLGKVRTVTDEEKNNGDESDKSLSPQEILDQTSNFNVAVVENQVNVNTELNNDLCVDLSKNVFKKNVLPVKTSENGKDATDLSKTTETKLMESDTVLNKDTEAVSSIKTINVLSDNQIIPASNDKQISLSKQEINNVCSKLETTFLSSGEIPLNISKEINTATKDILLNDGAVASRPISPSKEMHKITKNVFSSPDLDCRDKIHQGDGNFMKSSSNTVNTTRVILKKPAASFRQKYFFFKEMTSNNANNSTEKVSKSVFSNKAPSMTAKQDVLDTQNQLVDASDLRTRKSSTESVPYQIENLSLKTAISDPLPKPYYSESPDTYKKSNDDISHADNVNARQSYKPAENILLNETADENLPNVDSLKMSENYMVNFIEDSRMELDNSRNSDTSAMDLTKDMGSNLDNSNFTTRQDSMSRLSKKKQQSGVGQLLEELRSNDSVISVESVDSDCSEFITKRHRKRITRKRLKRKKKSTNYNNESSLNDSSIMIEPLIQQKSVNVKGCPSIHLKFEEDEDGTELKVTNVNKDKNTDESYIENITIRSDLDESKIEKPNIREEDILKSPSMKKMLPKVGDLIAFKILRITDNYTPEISAYITGKVVEFNTENRQIVFDILSGLDQCEEPKGKLSLEVDRKDTAASSRREFTWVDLVDPRLLYP